jgi:hypothetical protein
MNHPGTWLILGLALMAWEAVPCIAAPRDGAVPRDAAEEAVLENASTRVLLRGGRLVSLFDKARSLEHASPQADASSGVFRIQFVTGVKPAGDIDATGMACCVVRRSADAAEMAFDHARASARLRVNLGETPGETQWSLSVEPTDPAEAVARVTLPVIATPRSADGQEKRYLFPMFEGRFPPLSRPPRWRSYPSQVFAQMTACVGRSGGFLLWTDDAAGHVKAFGFTNRGPVSTFGVRHLMPYEAGRPWDMPYRTRVTFCGPTWQAAADVYRAWVTVQEWSRTPLRDRRDVPDLLRHPPLCLSTQLDKENLRDLPDRLAAWAERFGAPAIYRPLGWEEHGNWVGIDYFPPSIGEKVFRDLAAGLKERRIAIAGFISGYRWTTHIKRASARRNQDLADYFEKHDGPAVCERSRDGKLLAFQAEGRDSYRICRGTEFGRSFLPDVARALFDLGVTIIHDDQDHGPYPNGMESCFDASHGHPVPCGRWAADATRQSLQAIRAEAERQGLDNFFLTKESPTELLNMDLHAYQARFFHESTIPDLVPLAQYLYHEHIPAIFGWVTAGSRSTWELAAMLVYGQVPSLAFWNAPAKRPEALPTASQALLADYYDAMTAYARPFLLYGRMRPPLVADAPTARKEIRRIRNRELPRPVTIDVPRVIQSAWDDGQGRIGVFAVNTQREAAALKVPAPGDGRWRASVYLGAERVSEHNVAPGGAIEWRLPPDRLGAVIFQPPRDGRGWSTGLSSRHPVLTD